MEHQGVLSVQLLVLDRVVEIEIHGAPRDLAAGVAVILGVGRGPLRDDLPEVGGLVLVDDHPTGQTADDDGVGFKLPVFEAQTKLFGVKALPPDEWFVIGTGGDAQRLDPGGALNAKGS